MSPVFPAAVVLLLGGWLGASTASFLTLLSMRRRAGTQVTGRSRCACGRTLSPAELVPVAAWLVLRGRARCCGTALPATHLWGETAGATAGAACAAAAVILAALRGPAAAVALGAAAAACVIAAACAAGRLGGAPNDDRPAPTL